MSTPTIPYQDFVQQFYDQHREALDKHYPGLSLQRLSSELEKCIGYGPTNKKELQENIYFESRSHQPQGFFDKLLAGVPLEYISGRAFFYHSEFSVTPAVLIPRNETEILVEQTLMRAKKLFAKNQSISLCDVGTGSGAILLSLLQELEIATKAIGVDISAAALRVAKRNYFNLNYRINPNHQVQWIEGDRLDSLEGPVDIIVSNPPYIRAKKDYDSVHQQVQKYEPDVALYLQDEEYLEWYRVFLSQVVKRLKRPGLFVMEGHEKMLEDIFELAKELGMGESELSLLPDYTDRTRFLVWQR